MELIDKHAAYTALKHEEETHGLSFSAEAYDRAARIIDQMPTIEAEPVRHGRLEKSPTGNENYKYCSECGGCFYRPSPKVIYCPYCGAWMDGGAENG